MPKPIAEIVEATRPLDTRILQFLERAPVGQAFTIPEIYAEVERLDPELRRLFTVMWITAELSGNGRAPAPEWRAALDTLERSQKVQKRTLRGTDYFWAAGREGT